MLRAGAEIHIQAPLERPLDAGVHQHHARRQLDITRIEVGRIGLNV
jgi:hypothetical protein